MTEAVFDSVAAGVRHVMSLAVRNVSQRGLRVRLVPPRAPAFKLHVQDDVELAPGLEQQAALGAVRAHLPHELLDRRLEHPALALEALPAGAGGPPLHVERELAELLARAALGRRG